MKGNIGEWSPSLAAPIKKTRLAEGFPSSYHLVAQLISVFSGLEAF
jgi:hypothetical protein